MTSPPGSRAGGSDDRSPRVFVSYRRSDVPVLTRLVVQTLKDAFGDDKVFLDVEAVSVGQSVSGALESGLGNVDVVVAMIGPDWVGHGTDGVRILDEDDWVRREVAWTLHSGIPIVPVLAPGTPMPRGEDLPEDLLGLSDLNALVVRPDSGFEQDRATLIQAIWEAWAQSHDVVVLADPQHQVLTEQFIEELASHRPDSVRYVSQVAAGLGVLDFGLEEHRPLLIALLPDAEDWDAQLPRLQRVTRQRRIERLILVPTSLGGGGWALKDVMPQVASFVQRVGWSGRAPEVLDGSALIQDGRLIPDLDTTGGFFESLTDAVFSGQKTGAALPDSGTAAVEHGPGSLHSEGGTGGTTTSPRVEIAAAGSSTKIGGLVAALPLGAKAAIGVGVVVAVVTTAVVVGGDSPRLDVSGRWQVTQGQLVSDRVFDPDASDFSGEVILFEESDEGGFVVLDGPRFLAGEVVDPRLDSDDAVLASASTRWRGDCVNLATGSLIASDVYENLTTWRFERVTDLRGELVSDRLGFSYGLEGTKDPDEPAAAQCPDETSLEFTAELRRIG